MKDVKLDKQKLENKLQRLFINYSIDVSFTCGTNIYIHINHGRAGFEKSVEIKLGEDTYHIYFVFSPGENGTDFDFAQEMLKKLTSEITKYLKYEVNFNRAETIRTLKEIQGKLEGLIPKIPEELQIISSDDYNIDYSLSRALNDIKKIAERMENVK